jgi:energy-coupling factor transporter ATP-binding protein EcfA2
MEYAAFHFRNFKGIKTLDLQLVGPVTTLIGLNESGKTTILEAIFCFAYGAEDMDPISPGLSSIKTKDNWVPIAERGNFNGSVEIAATLRLNDDDKRAYRAHMRKAFGLSLAAVPNEIRVTEQTPFANSRATDTKRQWGLSVSGQKARQKRRREYGSATPEWLGAVEFFRDRMPRIWYFPNFLFELPERFPLGVQATDTGSSDRDAFYRGLMSNLLRSVDASADLDEHIAKRALSPDETDRRSMRKLVLDMARALTRKVMDGWNSIFSGEVSSREVEIRVETDEADTPFLELTIRDEDGYYDLSERSLGFRWFFMFLLMTSYSGLDKAGRDSLLLLDEPASNLHSSAQAELLKSFERLSASHKMIYTTHSHHMIDLRWLDAAYVVKNAALGDLGLKDTLQNFSARRTDISATRYRTFVGQYPDQTSYFQPVLDVLDYRPSAIEPVPNVILVEGKSDFYLLRYAIDVLDMEPDLRMVPGGGAGALDPVIRMHIAWGKSFVILLDGDKEGIAQRARYEREFGSLIGNRCVLIPEVISDQEAAVVEDVLTAEDRRAFIVDGMASERITKKAFQRAVMERYRLRQRVEISPRSTERIGAMLRTLDEQLRRSG